MGRPGYVLCTSVGGGSNLPLRTSFRLIGLVVLVAAFSIAACGEENGPKSLERGTIRVGFSPKPFAVSGLTVGEARLRIGDVLVIGNVPPPPSPDRPPPDGLPPPPPRLLRAGRPFGGDRDFVLPVPAGPLQSDPFPLRQGIAGGHLERDPVPGFTGEFHAPAGRPPFPCAAGTGTGCGRDLRGFGRSRGLVCEPGIRLRDGRRRPDSLRRTAQRPLGQHADPADRQLIRPAVGSDTTPGRPKFAGRLLFLFVSVAVAGK